MATNYMVNSPEGWQISPEPESLDGRNALLLAHARLARILHYC